MKSISPPAAAWVPVMALRRRLAGAVGADQAHQLALPDFQRHALDGLDAAVRDAQAGDAQQRLPGRRGGAGRAFEHGRRHRRQCAVWPAPR